MNYRQKLNDLIEKNDGLLLTKEVEDENIPREYLSIFLEEDKLERIKRGVYTTPDAFNDEMYIIQQKNTRLIYSHETALYLHDLSDRDPLEYTATVPYGYHNPYLKDENIKVHTVKKELHLLGIIEKETIYGRKIKVYNKERTICDILKDRNNMDISTVNEAIRKYLTGKDKDLHLLLDYGDKLKISSILRKYLEMFV
ncbi:Transcriptional regulator, predicted component of viral defense system [Halanaerobium congolense]|jgi:predicted transcriptional regulator of viral defense system|uniref:Transcriptional regulator, predicted component of viral defense system n=1 Tax=Halanaerobium congolense TaxID=54121 RepID=A0A1I0CRQ9_9FIRM|nr:type IV toxin-antitoxin system AbiEi family antitoxin domain-containing protein [Halanaerobium congolense]PTX14746.1 putative transcriptional regulator of viral defense system [Halanaerobium congolense]PTX14888.1 putative transcriptional regulator of viral defense system [Halanaerobium congolense]SDG13709.1 Transcriptional regulator, predicted component of viral defense system [Halanaerobium congolense]SET21749.1 Transcriptional regulator, predicted component of viral defense system [Halanae